MADRFPMGYGAGAGDRMLEERYGEDYAPRLAVVETAQAMAESGLSPGTSGNVSARADESGAMLITPTGVPYADLSVETIVRVEADGTVDEEQLRPSSEWHFHHAIYRAHPDAGGIVHTHSLSATALSCTRHAIPAFHYMVAIAGGRSIRCADYATFGTEALAQSVLRALEGRRACLMANHGQVALGLSPQLALALAHEVEVLAAQYVQVLSMGGGYVLSDEEMDRVIEKFHSYGQQGEEGTGDDEDRARGGDAAAGPLPDDDFSDVEMGF
ncbi:MAG: class II aldolase/adducin family protein [Alphaproteobacteria bacterium]